MPQFPKFIKGPDGRLVPLDPETQAQFDTLARQRQAQDSPAKQTSRAILEGLPFLMLLLSSEAARQQFESSMQTRGAILQ